MALFARSVLVFAQPVVDGLHEWAEYWIGLLLARRIAAVGFAERLAYGVARVAGNAGDLADGLAVDPMGRANVFVLIHPEHPLSFDCRGEKP